MSGFYPLSLAERAAAAVGGFFGILAVTWISERMLDFTGAAAVASSMGASAVLLFAVPHGSLSQPWPVFGGHLVSALAGVGCSLVFSDPWIAGPLAVALAIGGMQALRCLHPPGGGTALAATLGDPLVHALGWGYLFTPVAANAAVLLVVAFLFNYPFPWRRYPVSLAPKVTPPEPTIAHSDLVYALSQIDSFIDVEEEDLLRIYALATGREKGRGTASSDKADR